MAPCHPPCMHQRRGNRQQPLEHQQVPRRERKTLVNMHIPVCQEEWTMATRQNATWGTNDSPKIGDNPQWQPEAARSMFEPQLEGPSLNILCQRQGLSSPEETTSAEWQDTEFAKARIEQIRAPGSDQNIASAPGGRPRQHKSILGPQSIRPTPTISARRRGLSCPRIPTQLPLSGPKGQPNLKGHKPRSSFQIRTLRRPPFAS